MEVIHNTHQQLAIGITSGLLFLTTLIVAIRLYIRCILLKAGSAGWDDLTVSISWLMAPGASIATYFEINSGLGRHVSELTKEQTRDFELSLFIVIQFYSVGLNVVKISFLIQFYRIFPDQRIRQVCVYFAFFSFLWMIGQNILYALSCVPTTGVVNNPHLKDICVPTLPVWTAISSINVCTDLIIFSIPMRPLWVMPLLQRQRYLLIGIFCFGFIVVIISIVRIPSLPSSNLDRWPLQKAERTQRPYERERKDEEQLSERDERPLPSPLGSNPPDSIKDVALRTSIGPLRSPTYDEMLPPHFLENGVPKPRAKMVTRSTQTFITWNPLVDPFQVPEAIEVPRAVIKEQDLEANRGGIRSGHQRAQKIEVMEVQKTISPLASDAEARRENIEIRSMASRLTRSTRGNRRAAGISWLRLSGDSGFNSSKYWER